MPAIWKIYSNLRVTYYHPNAKDGAIQELGKPDKPDICKFNDVLGWAACEGDNGDVIYTSKGVFFIQHDTFASSN